MATQKSSGEDAKTSDDSSDSAPSESNASVAKSNQSKPTADEIRSRAYEVFQERRGGPGSEIGDWQKAEALASADAAKAGGGEADAAKAAQIPADTGTIRRRSPSSIRSAYCSS